MASIDLFPLLILSNTKNRKSNSIYSGLKSFLIFFLHMFNNRKKRAKQRIIEVPPLTKDKLQEIDDPLDYLYKYCIIQSVYFIAAFIVLIKVFFS